MIPYAVRIAAAMARSKPVPSFLRSAGDRLMVTFLGGSSTPRFRMAVRTRSWASRTSEARYPTKDQPGRPPLTSASTDTWVPHMPWR